MNATLDNPPAFPVAGTEFRYADDEVSRHQPQEGMTLRDYFAAHAMAARMANPFVIQNMAKSEVPDDIARRSIAVWAYRIADAMIEARAEQ